MKGTNRKQFSHMLLDDCSPNEGRKENAVNRRYCGIRRAEVAYKQEPGSDGKSVILSYPKGKTLKLHAARGRNRLGTCNGGRCKGT